MKKLFVFLTGLYVLSACNSSTSVDAEKSADTSATASVQLPYEMQYKDWKMGDPNNLKFLLDMYKNWDNNNMQPVVDAFADTCVFDTPSGYRMTLAKPAMLDSFTKWRGSNQSVSTEIVTGLSLHNMDKMEDWVTIWSMNKWTDSKGKSDSSFSNDNWQLKGGKIVFLSSLEQKAIKNP